MLVPLSFLLIKKKTSILLRLNPRVQVEHTITEEVTGVDIVRSQILIANGHQLSDTCIFINGQDDVKCLGYAIQCRITTEDPENNFRPDFG